MHKYLFASRGEERHSAEVRSRQHSKQLKSETMDSEEFNASTGINFGICLTSFRRSFSFPWAQRVTQSEFLLGNTVASFCFYWFESNAPVNNPFEESIPLKFWISG